MEYSKMFFGKTDNTVLNKVTATKDKGKPRKQSFYSRKTPLTKALGKLKTSLTTENSDHASKTRITHLNFGPHI